MQTRRLKFDDIRKGLEKYGYEAIKSIGKGGFGEVFLARQGICICYVVKTKDKFAVKVLNKAKII